MSKRKPVILNKKKENVTTKSREKKREREVNHRKTIVLLFKHIQEE